ncbi:hypothetical protein B0T21DRAFT_415451 [Apiosordaria backusii]|uniref:Uncharacterized protein n=1 Tax=Apiosordaria backusii TaxID=314023 RepID=A0AA40AE85_9PEZI|nr:hypothetical protein B0T21DRAFT_415451 [Apiosordaria backusii]
MSSTAFEEPIQPIDTMLDFFPTTPPKAYGERIANMEDMRKNHQERVARIKREQRQTKVTDDREETTTIRAEE